MSAKKSVVENEFDVEQTVEETDAQDAGQGTQQANKPVPVLKAGQPFDPAQYLSNFDGKDYLEVKWRLLWLRSQHPEARITTEIVQHNEESGFALFRAEVEVPTGGKATGWGSETVRDFHDYIEAAETKALGRALAALGYGTSTTLVAEKLSALMGGSSDTVLVAEDPTTGIVGVVSVHLVPLFHAAGNLARLTALAVLPGHQRKGVGRALVSAAEAFAWQRDCRRVEVTSGDHREDAHTFYRALGYEMDERRFIKHRSSAV